MTIVCHFPVPHQSTLSVRSHNNTIHQDKEEALVAGIQFATTEGIAVLKFSEECKRRSRFNWWPQRIVNWIISRGQQSLLWCVSP